MIAPFLTYRVIIFLIIAVFLDKKERTLFYKFWIKNVLFLGRKDMFTQHNCYKTRLGWGRGRYLTSEDFGEEVWKSGVAGGLKFRVLSSLIQLYLESPWYLSNKNRFNENNDKTKLTRSTLRQWKLRGPCVLNSA